MFDALRELMKEDLDEAARLGEERGREELILNSLRKKRTVEEVAEFLGISIEEVKVVAQKL